MMPNENDDNDPKYKKESTRIAASSHRGDPRLKPLPGKTRLKDIA